MPGIDDVQLDPHAPAPDGPDDRSRSPLRAVLVAAVLVALGVGAYFVIQRFRGPGPPAAPNPPAAAVEETAPPPAVPDGPLPALDASDTLVRELVRALSANPDLAAWLATEGLIRRVTVVVDNVAEGVSPAKHLAVAAPAEAFAVEGGEGDAVIAAASYRRYDRIAAAADGLDAAGVARLYRRLEPLFDQAYADLGYPGRRFRDTLAKAIRSLLAVPVPPARAAVEPGVRSYLYRDPRLEGLTAAQKQLLRMGPDNVRRIQARLREIAAALELPAG